MSLPVVAIVGRPNVGKSSLFNWLAGRRIAIVDPTAGVTRDRVSTLVEAGDRFFELIDTGGIGIEDVDNLTDQIERQIQLAIDQAHVILFVVDGRTGVVPLDEDVAEPLARTSTSRSCCVANKCDTLGARLAGGRVLQARPGQGRSASAPSRTATRTAARRDPAKLPPARTSSSRRRRTRR